MPVAKIAEGTFTSPDRVRIHPKIAVKYVHPDKGLPRIR
jgi:hypothetical protein